MKQSSSRFAIVKLAASVLIFFVLTAMMPPAHVFALTKEGTDSRGTYFVEDKRDYPVIFIPGMAGSEIENKTNGWNLWPGYLNEDYNDWDLLALAEDGSPKTVKRWLPWPFRNKGRVYDAVPKQVMRFGLGSKLSLFGDWRFFPVYQGFYDYMESEGYSYTPNMETGKQFFDFPYDFRKDNRSHVKPLDEKINDVLKQTKSDKVILYAHSMGGIVARLYMKDALRAKKVAAVVFMGTPHRGSPKAFWSLVQGYNFGNKKLSDEKMWEISGNWEGGYQLLPDYPFVQGENGAWWTFEETFSGNYITNQEWKHFSELVQRDGKNAPLPEPGLPNPEFAKKVIAFRNELGHGVDKYPGVKYYMIEGTEQETVQFLKAKLTKAWDGARNDWAAQPVLSLEEVTTPHGDGTVPAGGARIDGVDGSFKVKSEHGFIPSHKDAQMILTGLRKKINNETERERRVKQIEDYLKPYLDNVRSWASPPKTENEDSMAKLVFALFQMIVSGSPDAEKIKLKDQVRKLGSDALKLLHANIIVAEGTEQEDAFYVIVNDSQLISVGSGKVRPGTLRVKVDSFDTLDKILSGKLHPRDAVRDKMVTFTGIGIVEKFKAKWFEWIARYMTR